ncbi:MAG: glycosyltransferase family 2 protein [Chloroflexi bacterium]|nr:glycosyltransferase family 2 protein [Chloroflexota bacterium]
MEKEFNVLDVTRDRDVQWLSRARVSVIVPAMNEEENLPHVLPLIPHWVEEVILVDGHSTDKTVEVAQWVRPGIRVVQQIGKGKGAALRTGFDAARGDIIVMLDADGSTDPREIPGYVGLLLAGADFVKGSRYMAGGGSEDISLFRSLGNTGLLLAVKAMFGFKWTDLCYGYNAFWRRVLPDLNLDCDGFEIETLMNLRAGLAGLKIAECPSFEACRIHGESRLRALPDGWRVLKTIFRERARTIFGEQPATRPADMSIPLPVATESFASATAVALEPAS